MSPVEKKTARTPVRPPCRFCGRPLEHTFVDLGMSPPCESFVPADRLDEMEPFYPLHVWVCDRCFLVQLQEYVSPQEIFTEYAYFSSFSDSWLEHCRRYTAEMVERLGLGPDSLVVELASNDGYLLQYFVERSIPVLGIEPAVNVARAAEERGVTTLVEFFGTRTATELARQGRQADLIAANNVLAQVPDLNDFVAGMKLLLKPGGTITVEVPHLKCLIELNQFDTIYHEHFSYFSLHTARAIFEAHGMKVVDVDELPTHGGSLRLHACHADDARRAEARVATVEAAEQRAGMQSLDGYRAFAEKVKETKRRLLEFLIAARREGKSIVGYGAPGKGNTLLNYCGVRTDFIDYTVDRNEYKQGRFLPGTHIPIHHPDRIAQTRPDYVLILPWNLREEITQQLSYVREWGGKLVVPIPTVEICE